MLGKTEGWRRRGDRGWDGWMALLARRTWVWASSRSWWWTGKPGMLQSLGSQRVRHDWVTELNWWDEKCSRQKILEKRHRHGVQADLWLNYMTTWWTSGKLFHLPEPQLLLHKTELIELPPIMVELRQLISANGWENVTYGGYSWHDACLIWLELQEGQTIKSLRGTDSADKRLLLMVLSQGVTQPLLA